MACSVFFLLSKRVALISVLIRVRNGHTRIRTELGDGPAVSAPSALIAKEEL